jgi:hypothetical protein
LAGSEDDHESGSVLAAREARAQESAAARSESSFAVELTISAGTPASKRNWARWALVGREILAEEQSLEKEVGGAMEEGSVDDQGRQLVGWRRRVGIYDKDVVAEDIVNECGSRRQGSGELKRIRGGFERRNGSDSRPRSDTEVSSSPESMVGWPTQRSNAMEQTESKISAGKQKPRGSERNVSRNYR